MEMDEFEELFSVLVLGMELVCNIFAMRSPRSICKFAALIQSSLLGCLCALAQCTGGTKLWFLLFCLPWDKGKSHITYSSSLLPPECSCFREALSEFLEEILLEVFCWH